MKVSRLILLFKSLRRSFLQMLHPRRVQMIRNNGQVVDDKIMPSLNSIDGLGEKAADAIVEAAKDGPFLSKDDFRQRTKVSKTVVDLMDDLKLLGDLPESNQISLFDFAI